MSTYLLNGWGWGMPRPQSGVVVYHTLSEEEFKFESYDAISCIGHPGLAAILGVDYNPEYIQLNVGDTALVVSTKGKKLPYECRELPPGLTLEFKSVKILAEV